MAIYKHILFATDLTDAGGSIAAKVSDLASQFGSHLSLVHTIEPIPAYGYPGVTDLESPVIERAKAALTQLGKSLNVAKQDQHIEFGSIKGEVLRKAAELGVDLIIVGSHGRHGLARLIGSSASAIVNGAECDVLVLRISD